MKEKYILTVLLTLVIITLVYTSYGFLIDIVNPQVQDNKGISLETITTGSTDSGDVSIGLTPQSIDKNKLIVEIVANTHSIDLSQFDLKDITTLEYNKKAIKPTSAPSLKGHHSSGIFVFNLDEKITSFAVRINGIPNINERIFKW